MAACAGALLMAVPGNAQYSEQYQFLEAIKKRDVDKIVELMSAPGNTLVNSRDITTGESALHITVSRRDQVWTLYLLQQGANPNIQDKKGVTPLVLAAQIGFLEGIEKLIKYGARLDVPNSTGETPLIAAVHKRDIGVMRILLQAGANPDRADSSGRTARDYAMLDGPNSQLLGEIEKNEKPAAEREGAQTYGPSF